MKLIIAGGRNYHLTASDLLQLDDLPISMVISGGATGADAGGEQYAADRDLPVKVFRADWLHQGKAAGPRRNRRMAEYADAVALFSGGRGTASMHREAVKAEIQIYDFRSEF